MNPRYLLMASAVMFAALGFGLLFLPQEVMRAAGMFSQPELFAQLAGGGFLAVAMLNWSGRSAILGGIYGRPIILANLLIGIVGMTTLARGIGDVGLHPISWVVVGLLLFHVAAFAILMMRPPWQQKSD